jgi:hypothetical protein
VSGAPFRSQTTNVLEGVRVENGCSDGVLATDNCSDLSPLMMSPVSCVRSAEDPAPLWTHRPSIAACCSIYPVHFKYISDKQFASNMASLGTGPRTCRGSGPWFADQASSEPRSLAGDVVWFISRTHKAPTNVGTAMI